MINWDKVLGAVCIALPWLVGYVVYLAV